MKQFEDMTVRELRKLTEQFKTNNPDVKTAQEYLDEIDEVEE